LPEAPAAIEARERCVGVWLAAGSERLRNFGAPPDARSADLDAAVLLAHVLGRSRTWLFAHAEVPVAADCGARFAALIERRAAGEPIAYLSGSKSFWTLELTVGPAVLVPRPETELLVERALALLPLENVRAVDLGTGSGAIALALASERPLWRVTATDLSAQALALARANAFALGRELELLEGDWLKCLPGRSFELIVSNPPYVPAEDPALAGLGVRYEPRLALEAGADGMEHLRRIARDAPRHLVPGGWLLLEHGEHQARGVRDELVARGFAQVRSHRDLAGHERMTEGEWPRQR
jgi:release factor glutamine methyltransferase